MKASSKNTTPHYPPGVVIGNNPTIDDSVTLGYPPFGKKPRESHLKIGNNAFIRTNTVIYEDTTIGDNFQCGHNVVIREKNKIGNNVLIHNGNQLYPKNKIGNNVSIHAGCFLEWTTIEDDVAIGPNVTFTDDLHPRCPKYLECVGGATVKKNVKIGANVTILPGVTIGEGTLIGAGSVVINDAPSNSVVAGNPAKVIKKVDDLKCTKGFFKTPYEWEK